ncbi:MAG: restriction endonuclease [Verrucomicrobiales bacterium]|nr:restriction endonuclease [Verrucomicrobiales bacterium]
MSQYHYQITIRHDGLGKYRVIRGSDRGLVEGAALAQQRIWNEQYAKKLELSERRREREDKRNELEDNLQEASERTREAATFIADLRNILLKTLQLDDRIDWDKLKQLQSFSQPCPGERPYLPLPREPQPDENCYRPQLALIDKFLRSSAEKKEQAARALYEADHSKWQERTAAIQATNQSIYLSNVTEFESWQKRFAEYEAARCTHNDGIDRRRLDYQSLKPEAILDYCDLVLSQSSYPECCPQNFELDYEPTLKTVIVEYQLPSLADFPRVLEVKYVRSKGEFVQTEISKRNFEEFFEDCICQIAIRTLHELFEADVVRALDAIIFNGMVRAVNPGTGHIENKCILSVRTERAIFCEINLRNVNARACFDSLSGVAGSKLSDLNDIKPILEVNREGKRFSIAEDISGLKASAINEWYEIIKLISSPKDCHFLKVGCIASLVGFPQHEKYTAPLSRELANAVRARGFALEPDAALGGLPYKSEHEISLFRPLADNVSAAYVGASALLQLCVMIAAADAHPTDLEMKVARDFINKNSTLTPHDRQRLHFLENLLCRNPAMARRPLSRLAKRLPVEQRQMVGEVLVCVAGADGIITSSEWVALDRACKSLDLPVSALEDILRRLGASFEEPVMMAAEPAEPGEPLPVLSCAPDTTKPPAFKLDMTRVAAISHETAQVIDLLSTVMREDGSNSSGLRGTTVIPVNAISREVPHPLGSPAWLASLNSKYHSIAMEIFTKSNWTRAEFQNLSAQFKLMPLDVYDALNEWSDEQLGDFLIEGEDPVTVNKSILPN